MKILGITILIFVLLTSFSVGMDVLLGFDLKTSIKNAVNPFLVMEVAEIAIFCFLLMIWAFRLTRSFYKKK